MTFHTVVFHSYYRMCNTEKRLHMIYHLQHLQRDVTSPCKYSEEGMSMRAIFITCNLTWFKDAGFLCILPS